MISIEPQFKENCNLSFCVVRHHATMVAATSMGERLTQAMDARSVSVAELASKTSLTYQAIAKIKKSNTKAIEAASLFAICSTLKIRPLWLFYGEEPRDADAPGIENVMQRVNWKKVHALAPPDLALLEAALLIGAANLGIDIKPGELAPLSGDRLPSAA